MSSTPAFNPSTEDCGHRVDTMEQDIDIKPDVAELLRARAFLSTNSTLVQSQAHADGMPSYGGFQKKQQQLTPDCGESSHVDVDMKNENQTYRMNPPFVTNKNLNQKQEETNESALNLSLKDTIPGDFGSGDNTMDNDIDIKPDVDELRASLAAGDQSNFSPQPELQPMKVDSVFLKPKKLRSGNKTPAVTVANRIVLGWSELEDDYIAGKCL